MSDFDHFAGARVAHIRATRHAGDAAETVLRPDEFAIAIDSISAWPGYEPTPLYSLDGLAQRLGLDKVLYKDEGPRFGLGSFKALGGAYAAARVLQREIARLRGAVVDLVDICNGDWAQHAADITLVCATDGNHGRSLAWGAQRFGARCRVYIHALVSEGRAEAIRALGADVIRIQGDYDDSVRIASQDTAVNGWHLVSDTSADGCMDATQDVMAGYGVMSHEINLVLQQPPSHVLLQGGVGGLAASVCAAMRQHWAGRAPRVIVVEPEQAACLYASAGADSLRAVDVLDETLMAGLSCGEPSAVAWSILREEASDFLTIPDCLVGPTMRILAQPLGKDPVVLAGESGVAGLAAAIAIAGDQRLRLELGFDSASRVLLIGSEGVTDPAVSARILAG